MLSQGTVPLACRQGGLCPEHTGPVRLDGAKIPAHLPSLIFPTTSRRALGIQGIGGQLDAKFNYQQMLRFETAFVM
ncbi:hypothetical protein CDV36_016437 [Fusarium kuroshium]|uniref:Uncharacterized protein n=1 Tax=Fusarium kuroshium TaxID=2010991 RepID=A0A3M2QPU8_9HYPO|nr:hypothetical protein CDV36_016437 [Fusarium kuroshium]